MSFDTLDRNLTCESVQSMMSRSQESDSEPDVDEDDDDLRMQWYALTGKNGDSDSSLDEQSNPRSEEEPEPEPWTFHFQDISIDCDGPPWPTDGAETVHIPEHVALRGPAYLMATTLPPFDPALASRNLTWGVVKIAELGTVDETALFRFYSQEDLVTLRPEFRSAVPLQWVHFGRGVLSDEVANTLCTELSPAELLVQLNTILGTTYSIHRPGLRSCLKHFLSSSRDFGQVYGSLRRRWKGDFTKLVVEMETRRELDETFRHNAVNWKASYIRDASVPPRRIWDLYSNRVLPFHTIPNSLPQHIPETVWTVSHSWVADEARISVQTPINGRKWPVPIPRDTTLEHVRVELLNLGAEYVWLDVLCLRQRGSDEDEQQRRAEWGLDVPTIGYVYSDPYRICVTYFNGLGLPFDPSPSVLNSDRHWINRVWTVQEGTEAWLPGGLTGAASLEAIRFFRSYHDRACPRRERDVVTYFLDFALNTLRDRYCTTELDRVSSLAYMLKCPTLPVYSEGATPEQAWRMLFDHLLPHLRTSLAFWHLLRYPHRSNMWPLWGELLEDRSSISPYHVSHEDDLEQILRAVNENIALGTPATYYHTVDVVGPCFIVQGARAHEDAYADEDVLSVDEDLDVSSMNGDEDALSLNDDEDELSVSGDEDALSVNDDEDEVSTSTDEDVLSIDSDQVALSINWTGSMASAESDVRFRVAGNICGTIHSHSPYYLVQLFRLGWLIVEVVERTEVKGREALQVLRQGSFSSSYSTVPARIPRKRVVVVYSTSEQSRD
ncbi:hypothetical protein PsYK624_097380 [Phanerochaete sordida]|uniref:Heterokaryon incompatibility domain-containing protein n=1 Tax=Phanerochaete sordida TaxID=48140 RepID=A0A9P3LGF6_9APHY|nr:hypothetical protein PsYK624_097380 [Phanerochaete sordida]